MDDRTQALMAQIDALSISESSPSLDTTIVGVGSLSGRALMALGEFTLRGIESVTFRMRLRTIAFQLSQQGEAEVPGAVYDVLLELQRAGLYSDGIRFAAWDLILGEMEIGQIEGIVSAMFRWPWIEIEVFIRQLALSRSKNWTTYPGSMVRRSARTEESKRVTSVTKSYRQMLKAVLLRFHDPLELDKVTLIEDADLDSIVLSLQPRELNVILDSLVERPLSEIRTFVQQILISKLDPGEKTQQIATAGRVLAILSTLWQREPNLTRAIVDLSRIISYLPSEMLLPSLEDDVTSLFNSQHRALITIAANIHDSAGLEHIIVLLALATEPAILMLPDTSMQNFVSILDELGHSQIERYLRALVLSKHIPWSQCPETLRMRIMENLVELFWSLRRHAIPTVQELFSVESLTKSLLDSSMDHPRYPVIRSLLRKARTTDDLDCLAPLIDAQPNPVILFWTEGVDALSRALLGDETHQDLLTIQEYLQRFIFVKRLGSSMMTQHPSDYGDLAENSTALALALWKQDPSYIRNTLPSHWVTTIYSSHDVYDPIHKIFQVVLRLSRDSFNHSAVCPILGTHVSKATAAVIKGQIDECTPSQVKLYVYQLVLGKAIQWWERVETEAVVEDVLDIVCHIWRRHPDIVHSLLDCVDAGQLQSRSKYSKTLRNVAQCIVIALLAGQGLQNDIQNLLPVLQRDRTPIILLLPTERVRVLFPIFRNPESRIEDTLSTLALSKLQTCFHQPLKVRQRIMRNLHEILSTVWTPDLRIDCPNLDLGWIVDSIPTGFTSIERSKDDLVMLMECISRVVDCPSSAWVSPDGVLQRFIDTSRPFSHDIPEYSIFSTVSAADLGNLEANIWIMLRCILHHDSKSDSFKLTDVVYSILFGLRQYPRREAIRNAVWDLLLYELCQGNLRDLTDALLLRPDHDILLFLRQLKEANSTSWKVYPGTSTPWPVSSSRVTAGESATDSNGIMTKYYAEFATEIFLQLLLTVLEEKPALVHTTLSWTDLLEYVNTRTRPNASDPTKMMFNGDRISSSLTPSSELLCCIRFLEFSNMEDSALESVFPRATTYLDLICILHVSLPLLGGRPTKHLEEMIQNIIADSSIRLDLIRLPNVLSNIRSELYCLLLVHAWGSQHGVRDYSVPQSLLEHLAYRKGDITDVLEWGPPWTDSRIDLVTTWATLYVLECFTLARKGVGIVKLHWIRLLMIFGRGLEDPPLWERAYGVLLCCAASPEDQWGSLIEALRHDSCAHLVATFMRQLRSMYAKIPRQLAQRLYIQAKLRGLAVVNPINRLVLLLREASQGSTTIRRVLKQRSSSEIRGFLQDVRRRTYDYLGRPSKAEILVRDEACDELQSWADSRSST